jgi:hypothetical protein
MTKRTLACCGAVLLSLGALYSACGDTVTATNCKSSCQDVDTTCVQRCTDDACKTKCATDLDHCTASCSIVTVSPPDGG